MLNVANDRRNKGHHGSQQHKEEIDIEVGQPRGEDDREEAAHQISRRHWVRGWVDTEDDLFASLLWVVRYGGVEVFVRILHLLVEWLIFVLPNLFFRSFFPLLFPALFVLLPFGGRWGVQEPMIEIFRVLIGSSGGPGFALPGSRFKWLWSFGMGWPGTTRGRAIPIRLPLVAPWAHTGPAAVAVEARFGELITASITVHTRGLRGTRYQRGADDGSARGSATAARSATPGERESVVPGWEDDRRARSPGVSPWGWPPPSPSSPLVY